MAVKQQGQSGASLAVTNTMKNSLVMGLGLSFVTALSSLTLSAMRNIIPHRVRMLVQTLRLDSTLRLGLSGIHADAWRTALQQQGVAATRLQLQGSEGKGLTLQPLR